MHNTTLIAVLIQADAGVENAVRRDLRRGRVSVSEERHCG
jgi:hypothetical protein